MSKYDNSDQRAGAAAVKTLSPRSVKIALSILQAFQDSSLYRDYKREDGWRDWEFDTLISELSQMEKKK